MGLILVALLLADLYRAEFGTPEDQPTPITTTVGLTPPAVFTQTQVGVMPPPSLGQPTGYQPVQTGP